MDALDRLGRAAQAAIKRGTTARRDSERHFIRAGICLLRAKDRVAHGGWLPWLKKYHIAERTAQEYMALAEGKITRDQVRKQKTESSQKSRVKSALSSTDSNTSLKRTACDYDWDNPSLDDFPSPLEMYKKQASIYCNDAIHLATAYPMIHPHVKVSDITNTEVRAVQAAAKAWQDLATKIQRQYEEGRNDAPVKKVFRAVCNS
jgi:hypothetical protein